MINYGLTKLDNNSVDIKRAARFSVAPMMDWTDRHCRYFHRKFTKNALLYTEMVSSAALVKGKAFHLLDHSTEEHPLALQLGGSDPIELSEAAAIGENFGYKEINLNVGCPSDRVQSGAFGAILMKKPKLVEECCRAMIEATSSMITVKCRIGVDDQDPNYVLPLFLHHVANAGIKRVIIHARKAILKGLSPKDNRSIPPLNYDLVFKMKEQFPDMIIALNGGISDLEHAKELIAKGIDGVMIGRAAYKRPSQILSDADDIIFMDNNKKNLPLSIAIGMRRYIENHVKNGGRPHQVTRHMMGLFHGMPGAKAWKQNLTSNTCRRNLDYYDSAIYAVSEEIGSAAA